MQAGHLTRRFVLRLPLALAACGGDEARVYDPLRYNYLPPIQLNVASIAIEQRFVPAGVAPDVSNQDPVPPAEALKAMANDRLQAFGTANKAVFAINDASLTRQGDVVVGSIAVSLTIVDDNGTQLGFAEARVQSRHVGDMDDLASVLYDMTKNMMNDMNIEFEYQIRHNLRDWLTNGAAPDRPVEQAPLDQASPPPQMPPQPQMLPSPQMAPPQIAPQPQMSPPPQMLPPPQ
jgi:hypothetical protein